MVAQLTLDQLVGVRVPIPQFIFAGYTCAGENVEVDLIYEDKILSSCKKKGKVIQHSRIHDLIMSQS